MNSFESFDFESTLFSRNMPNFCWLCSQFVSLTMTLFSEKVLISNRCISGSMYNLIEKSWTDSNADVLLIISSHAKNVLRGKTEQRYKNCELALTSLKIKIRIFSIKTFLLSSVLIPIDFGVSKYFVYPKFLTRFPKILDTLDFTHSLRCTVLSYFS